MVKWIGANHRVICRILPDEMTQIVVRNDAF